MRTCISWSSGCIPVVDPNLDCSMKGGDCLVVNTASVKGEGGISSPFAFKVGLCSVELVC